LERRIHRQGAEAARLAQEIAQVLARMWAER
jgi:hypothetical protein